MSDAPPRTPTDWSGERMQRRIARRYRAERRFRLLGLAAIALSAAFLLVLLGSMLTRGIGGFTETRIALPLDLAAAKLAVDPARLKGRGADLALADAGLEDAVAAAANAAWPTLDGAALLSDGAWLRVRGAVKADPTLLVRRATVEVPVASAIDIACKGDGTPEAEAIVRALGDQLSRGFNRDFLTAADSTDPTRVGIWGALKGSLMTMFVTIALAFPVGVLAALYLEEYAPRNRWTDLIEVSINNLAAVPSIIFGLLGLAVFLGTFGLPRSAAIVGGLTLALMTMPVIVIAGRNAIRAVPPSIRDAALGVGASPVQVVFHHVLPLAMPGILKLLVYQALLPRLCADCAVPAGAAELVRQEPGGDAAYWRRWLGWIGLAWDVDPAALRLRNPDGCARCRRAALPELFGYEGRTVAAECLEPGLPGAAGGSGHVPDPHASAMAHAMEKAAAGLVDPRDVEVRFMAFETLLLRQGRLPAGCAAPPRPGARR